MVARLVFAVFTIVAVTVAAQMGASAQDDPSVVAAPDPELCTLDARTIEEIELLVNEVPSSALEASPTAVANPFEMPDGFSLVEDELLEVERDLTRAVSCFNTGDPLKVFATYTDRYVVQLVEELGGLSEEVIAGLSTVRPLRPDDYIQIVSIEESLLLHDGRVLIVVAGDNPADATPAGARAFYLEEVLPGRWLIDEVVEIELE